MEDCLADSILVCILLVLQVGVVVNVTAYIDYQKQSLFASLQGKVDASNKKTVIRNGETVSRMSFSIHRASYKFLLVCNALMPHAAVHRLPMLELFILQIFTSFPMYCYQGIQGSHTCITFSSIDLLPYLY